MLVTSRSLKSPLKTSTWGKGFIHTLPLGVGQLSKLFKNKLSAHGVVLPHGGESQRLAAVVAAAHPAECLVIVRHVILIRSPEVPICGGTLCL